ncbi:MAG TPA: hypothetical protein VNB95_01250 [Nitrososphaera sp.]|nr:hypothetical protein [Nitrososphaera sp.]
MLQQGVCRDHAINGRLNYDNEASDVMYDRRAKIYANVTMALRPADGTGRYILQD